ncbi:helix-turn-helix transcriptional regulator [Pelagimonas sp. KU-00592-HH]|uniref:helix-turn-helix domain-containing protein n=1 Tax=Pelagimonas sp. KU-00592-HH TaxID=3127651 RepID=UPI003341F920
MSIRSRLSSNLRLLRLQRRWSQAELANHSGLECKTIRLIESETALPTIEDIDRIASALEVNCSDLLDEFEPE